MAETTRLQQLSKFLEGSPNDPFILFAIAKEYEKFNDDANALLYYNKVNAADADYVGLYYHLGKLYERKEEFLTAFRIYQTGMEVAKRVGDQHAFNELAGAKLELGDDENDFM